MPRSNASFLGQLLGTSQKITASALDDSVSASLGGGSSVTAYATAAVLPLSGNTVGDQAYVSETGRLYIFTGAGWYNIALINTNPAITSGADASYSLSNDGTPTVLTLVANDPEGIPITWSYAVTTGSLSNGGGTSAVVTQADNVFTITPSTNEAHEGDFGITFTASDGVNLATSASTFSLSWTIPPTAVEYLVIAGGGGGSGRNSGGGAGGAGGYRSSVVGELSGGGAAAEPLMVITEGTTYSVTVGQGGAGGIEAGVQGEDSVFGNIISLGGGRALNSANGTSGGSGGGSPGSGNTGFAGGAGTANQGYGGGNNNTSHPYPTGGGGGAGGPGGSGSGTQSGVGGAGLLSSITGSGVWRAGGGGGASTTQGATRGVGGSGGGGDGADVATYDGYPGGWVPGDDKFTSPQSNSGSGGGGGTNASPSTSKGGRGDSGVVILRYADSYSAAASTTGSPTITVAGGYRVYTFTQSGSITF